MLPGAVLNVRTCSDDACCDLDHSAPRTSGPSKSFGPITTLDAFSRSPLPCPFRTFTGRILKARLGSNLPVRRTVGDTRSLRIGATLCIVFARQQSPEKSDCQNCQN